MIKTSKKDLTDLLISLGLKKKTNVLFHSSLLHFGKIEGGINSLYTCARNIIGDEGNIIVPTFTYSYRINKVFNVKKSKSYTMIGAFSEHIRKKKNSFRNTDPLFSFSCIGPDKKKLIERKSLNCFGKNSVYEKLQKKNILIINLGITYSTGVTAFIHLEKLANISYRKDKIFRGISINHQGKKIVDKAKHFIKDEKFFKSHKTNREKVGIILEKKGISKAISKRNCKHFSLKFSEFSEEVYNLLVKKPFLMIEKK